MSNKNKFAPVSLFVALALIIIVVWQWTERWQIHDIHRDTVITAEQVAIRLETFIGTRTVLVKNIAEKWSNGEVHDQTTFYDEVQRVRGMFPGFFGISWIDSQGVIRWAGREKERQALVGVNIRKHSIVGPVFENAKRTGAPHATPPFDLLLRGKGMALYFPLNRAGRFDGSISAVFRISELIEEALRIGVKENYFFTITDGDNPVYSFGTMPKTHPYRASHRLSFLDREWILSLMPTPRLINSHVTRAGQVILALGLLLSAGLAWFLHLYLIRHWEVRESEARFRELIEGSLLGIQVSALDGARLFVNQKFVEMLGFDSAEEILAITEPGALLAPHDRQRIIGNRHAHQYGEELPETYEFDVLRKDGSFLPVQAYARPLIWQGKKAIQRTFIDITKRKKAEDALRDSEERFSSVFNNSPASISLKDMDGRFRLVNATYLKWFGVTEKDVLGKTTTDILPGKLADASRAQERRTIESGEVTEREQQIEFPSGQKAQVVITKFPVLSSDGKLIGIGTMIADVTNERKTAAQLLHAQKMEAVGQLTGGLAHDFNNLLAATLGNAQLLERKLAGQDDLLDMVGPIIKATRRGAELTHRLLAFSRKQALQPKPVRLGKLCQGMNGLLKRSLGETIEIKIVDNEDTWNVLTDPGQVESALLNLAINASHAMADGGKLTIGIKNVEVTDREWAKRWEGRPGDYVMLSVADTGTGIPADVIEHVFEPFFTTKDVGQGSGLGLSMVYGFAQQSGGFTAIESEPDSGTTVMIYLPKTETGQVASDAPALKPEIQESRGKTILLVEDEADVRNVMAKVLETLGYTVLVAEDGTSALEITSNTERIDLLLSDMVLPGSMNGIEICNRLREQRPSLKCVFMTGYSTISDEDLPEGTEILAKPVDIDNLAAKSRQILDA